MNDERNPYYDKEKAENSGINLLVSATMTPGKMLHFLINHDMLPDIRINSIKGPARGKQLVQENMDFIARFMRGNNYMLY